VLGSVIAVKPVYRSSEISIYTAYHFFPRIADVGGIVVFRKRR
jgi:hypothetical protein